VSRPADLAGQVVQGLAPPFAFCAVALAQGGDRRFWTATAPGLAATPHTLWRAASISKIVTGRVVAALAAAAGLQPPYAVDIAPLLGFALRNPAFPDHPLTLGQVASHTAGLSDGAGYMIAPDQTLAGWFAAQGPAAFGPHRPGAAFAYCNLGYVLLAAVAERWAGERFDHLARRLVLGPLGITGGFNWSGVADRSDRLATFRRDGAALIAQIDATVAATGVSAPDGREVDLTGWQPGRNPAPFSPQGGLRLSLTGALTLAQSLARLDDTPLWQGEADGLPQGHGIGLMHLPAGPVWPRPLIGHFANAYGFCGGVWHDRQAGVSLAYALNGLPLGDDSDALRQEELAILRALAAIVD